MDKRSRQYIGLFSAILAYYIIHEGAHLVYALLIGVFKRVNVMGLGVQIDVFAERMNDTQLGIFCIIGSVFTTVIGYILVFLASKVETATSKVFMACMYYITIAMLLIDPLYLSVLCGFFGGGDMNGISILVPEWIARVGYGALLLINIVLFVKIVLPKYTMAFNNVDK